MLKRTIKMSMVFILILCTIIGVSPIPVGVDATNLDSYYEGLMQSQEQAILADICLETALNTDGNYPENYGGKYIDGDKLIINLVSMQEEDCIWYKNVLCDFEGYYDFSEVEYSYEELLLYKETIVDTLLYDGIEVTESAISQKNNNIYIGVNKNEKKRATDRISQEISTSAYAVNNGIFPTVEICEISPDSTLTTDITGGTTNLYNANTSSSFSAGVCGTYDGNPAILTCGHVQQSIGDTIKSSASGLNIGTVVRHCYAHGTIGDYEIIKVTNTDEFNTTNTIANQYSVKGVYSNPSEGVIVKTYGKNSGYAYGEVYRTNVSITHSISNYTINGMTRVAILAGSCTNGDSGSPFFTSSSYSYTLFAGILSSFVEENDVLYVSFTPWTNISGTGFSVLTS